MKRSELGAVRVELVDQARVGVCNLAHVDPSGARVPDRFRCSIAQVGNDLHRGPSDETQVAARIVEIGGPELVAERKGSAPSPHADRRAAGTQEK